MNEIYTALKLKGVATTVDDQRLPSCFAASDLAASSTAAVGEAITNLLDDLNLVNTQPVIQVDRRLASLWFAQSVHPIDWQMPPIWDAIAGDYETSDGWIRIHTNLPHHRAAELLSAYPQNEDGTLTKEPPPQDFSRAIETTPWGQAHRLKPALEITGTPMEWDLPACALGSSPAAWLS